MIVAICKSHVYTAHVSEYYNSLLCVIIKTHFINRDCLEIKWYMAAITVLVSMKADTMLATDNPQKCQSSQSVCLSYTLLHYL